MTIETAASFFKAVQKDQELEEKIKAVDDAETFVKIAAERGYNFTVEELQAELNTLSPEDLAAVVNPGIGVRCHLIPR